MHYAVDEISCYEFISLNLNTWTMGVRRNFSRGSKVDILLICFRLLVMQRKWTHTKNKMFSVTTTVAYSVFLVRKFYSEQMLVLVSMDF